MSKKFQRCVASFALLAVTGILGNCSPVMMAAKARNSDTNYRLQGLFFDTQDLQ